MRFRPHPVAVQRGQHHNVPRAVTSEQSLADDLAGAAVVVTFNSNTGVDAVLAGKPTVTMDAGAMAWPVTDHVLGQHGEYDRESWAYRMAWKQWRDEEISSGDAIARLLEVMPNG